MSKKIVIRMALGLFAIAVIMAAYNWFKDFSKDPNRNVTIDSVDMISALELTDNGATAVVFTPDGKTLRPDPPSKENFEDRQVQWNATGNAVFFSSSRESDAFNIYRWIPTEGRLEKRSQSGRSLTTPSFGPLTYADGDTGGLLTAGGTVLSYDPKEQVTRQVLPPASMQGQAASDEGGAVSAMAAYEKFGTSFRDAYWGPDRRFIYAIMRRDQGEILILQPMEGGPGQPIPLMAASRINLSVAANGQAVFSFQDFQFIDPQNVSPEFIKDGVVTKPYKHGIFVIRDVQINGDQVQPMVEPIVVFMDDQAAAGDVALSPDGSQLVAVMGTVQDGISFSPQVMIIAPATTGGLEQGGALKQGLATQPSFSPDGEKIVYLFSEGDGRSVYVMNRDGSGERRVSDIGKDYSGPRFSPQLPAGE